MKPAIGIQLGLSTLVLAICASGCLGRHAAEASPSDVKVEVGQVGVDDQTGMHYVMLRDREGRSLPIMIGDEEARAILLAMHGIRMERPLTAQLLSTVIEKTGNHLDRAVVNAVQNQTYYAYLELDDGRYRIDCRPSDAIALAMDTDAPIYVNDRLLEKASTGSAPSGQIPAVRQALGLTLQELTPDVAGYFDAAPNSGLLVVDAAGAAAAAGIARGDIIVRLDGAPLKTLDAFDAAAAKLDSNAAVTMVVRHAGVERKVSFTNSAAPALSRGESSQRG